MKKSLLTFALMLAFALPNKATAQGGILNWLDGVRGMALSDTTAMTNGQYMFARIASGDTTFHFGTPAGSGGTVTSVALAAPTGLTVSGSPVTSSGTLALSYTAGYVGYTTAEASKLSGIAAGAQVNVATNLAQGTRTTTTVPITSSTGSSATLSVATASLAGVMSSADKTKLDGIATGATANTGTVTSVSGTGTVSGLTLSGSVTGSGNLTLGGSISGLNTSVLTAGTLPVARGGTGITSLASGMATFWGSATSANLRGTLTDETGTGVAVFSQGPTFTRMVTADSVTVNYLNVGVLVGAADLDSAILTGITPGNALTVNADGKVIGNNVVKMGPSQLAFFNGALSSRQTVNSLTAYNPVTATANFMTQWQDVLDALAAYNLLTD